MLGFSSLSFPHPPLNPNAVSSSILPSSFSYSSTSFLTLRPPFSFSSLPLETPPKISRKYTKLVALAAKGDGGPDKDRKEVGGEGNRSNGSSGDGDLGRDQRPPFNFRWGELLLNPDPDNILAVALTGLLTWAGVQVLLQLFFISLAILVAAIKYSFIAALLIFILITLL